LGEGESRLPRIERVSTEEVAMAVMQEHGSYRTSSAWVMFAGVIMAILGAFHVIDGLTAIFNDEYYVVGKSGLVLELDFTAWGWAHVVLGVLLFVAALSLLSGHMYGRIAGVTVATLSAIVNLTFLAAYPVWSVIMIAMDIIVIYAIVVHGRELDDAV
jgi:hypothetical protein